MENLAINGFEGVESNGGTEGTEGDSFDEVVEIEEDVEIDGDTGVDKEVEPLLRNEKELVTYQRVIFPDRLPADTEKWKLVIIDDDAAVHQATQLVLRSFKFEGKSLELISVYSGCEGRALLSRIHSEISVVLLDVVMEDENSGLKLVRYIREELKNHRIRIILRTGQPGEAPEDSVIFNYDINDYQLKVELTRQRLLTTVLSALRSFRDIITIERQRLDLACALGELQRSQYQLKKYSHTLEIKVSQRTSELEKANRELYRLANLDGLTQVANRRCFDQVLQEKWQMLLTFNQPIALVLVDVDHFKRYNDYYGHLAGDECLRKLATVLKEIVVRPQDLVARYGGEEFVLLLPNTSVDGAARVAERLIKKVRQLQWPHVMAEVADYVTLSIGVSWLIPQPETGSTSLIEMADRALYQSKQSGRDRYCVYGQSWE
jgi:diguanylate cyclase (GGDEF)-like protein